MNKHLIPFAIGWLSALLFVVLLSQAPKALNSIESRDQAQTQLSGTN